MSTQDKINDVKAVLLRDELVELDEELDILCNALVSRHHVYLIGEPGVAKSYTAKRLFLRIAGVRLYHDELFPMSTDASVLGPPSVPALKAGKPAERVLEGCIPWADLAIIDEMPRGSGSLLAGLHSCLNERAVRNGGQMMDIPLSTAVATANSLLVDDHKGLAALVDRILFYKIVNQPSASGLRRMLSLPEPDPHPPALVDWDDMLKAQDEAKRVVVPAEVLDAMIEVRTALGKEGINVSPRRLRQVESVIRAQAWLREAGVAELGDMEIISHCLWTNPDQRRAVDHAVVEVASPKGKEALRLSHAVIELVDRLAEAFTLDEADPHRTTVAIELFKKSQKTAREVLALERAPGRAGRIASETMRRLESLHAEISEKVYGIVPGQYGDLRSVLAAPPA